MNFPIPAAVTATPEPRYGNFTNRMIACTIDVGVLLMVALPFIEQAMTHIFPPVNLTAIQAVANSANGQFQTPEFHARLWAAIDQQRLVARVFVMNLLQVLCIAAYIVPFWFRFSTSPGKMLFRLIIVDEKTGNPMTRGQSVLRFLGYIASAIPFTLGFVYILFNKKKRGFHDILAGTVVIVKPRRAKEATDA